MIRMAALLQVSAVFFKCVKMQEYNNNFAFPSHSSIYTAIRNTHCFFFSASILVPVYHRKMVGSSLSFGRYLPFS